MTKTNFHQIFVSEFGSRLAEKGSFKTTLNGKPGPSFNRIFNRMYAVVSEPGEKTESQKLLINAADVDWGDCLRAVDPVDAIVHKVEKIFSACGHRLEVL